MGFFFPCHSSKSVFFSFGVHVRFCFQFVSVPFSGFGFASRSRPFLFPVLVYVSFFRCSLLVSFWLCGSGSVLVVLPRVLSTRSHDNFRSRTLTYSSKNVPKTMPQVQRQRLKANGPSLGSETLGLKICSPHLFSLLRPIKLAQSP